LRVQGRQVSEVWRGPELILDQLRDRINATCWNDVASEGCAVVEGIGYRGWGGGKITLSPGQRGHGRVDTILGCTATRGFEGKVEECAVATVVELGDEYGSSRRKSRLMENAGSTFGVKVPLGAEARSGVVIERRSVQNVGTRLRDDRHLPDRGELRRVICQIEMYFLECLDVIRKRPGLGVVYTIGECGAVD